MWTCGAVIIMPGFITNNNVLILNSLIGNYMNMDSTLTVSRRLSELHANHSLASLGCYFIFFLPLKFYFIAQALQPFFFKFLFNCLFLFLFPFFFLSLKCCSNTFFSFKKYILRHMSNNSRVVG